MRLQRPAILFCVLFFLNLSFAEATEFLFNFRVGDRYRIISTVNQDILVDRRLAFRAEIINRITMEVVEVTETGARQIATFQSAESTVTMEPGGRAGTAPAFQWSRDHTSEFITDRLGRITIGDEFFMPMVRNVPVFPGRALRVGETWSAPGVEVHDFRDNFGIEKPYRIPFTALYTYLGERTWRDTSFPAFSVSYRILMHAQPVPGRVFPVRIQGSTDKIVFWDAERGQPAAYEGTFRMIISLSNGQTWEYRGRAEAEVIEAPPMDREEMLREITEEIAGIADATVRISDEGIVISLENIQFAPDSAVLLSSEMAKLDIIADILMRFPDRDILVTGHTALAGTAAGRLQLSRERAAAVANYLIRNNVRSSDRVIIRGYGAERPIADNRTPAGMARNRRVEITILEN